MLFRLPVPHVCADPPLAGVLIASTGSWAIGQKGEVSPAPVFRRRRHLFAIGAVFACITGGTFANFLSPWRGSAVLNWPFFVGPVNGIVVSLVLYGGPRSPDVRKRMPAKAQNRHRTAALEAACGNPLLLHGSIITKEGKGHAKIGIPEIEDIATGAALLGAVVAVIPM